MPRRRIRYATKPDRACRAKSSPDVTLFTHTVPDLIDLGLQGTIPAGAVMDITQTVSCANGVWLKGTHLGARIWFLSRGQTRSYRTIYQSSIEET